jgi:hypothetical protein
MREYGFEIGKPAFLISGSKTSGAFSLGNQLFRDHPRFAGLFQQYPGLVRFQAEEGMIFPYKGRGYGWVRVKTGGILQLPAATLTQLGLQPGDQLMVIRGSNLAFDYAIRGPLVERARQHPEILVFSC